MLKTLKTKNYTILINDVQQSRFSQIMNGFGSPSKSVIFSDAVTNSVILGFVIDSQSACDMATGIKLDSSFYINNPYPDDFGIVDEDCIYVDHCPYDKDFNVLLYTGESVNMTVHTSPSNLEHKDLSNGDMIISFVMGDNLILPITSQDIIMSFNEAKVFANELGSCMY